MKTGLRYLFEYLIRAFILLLCIAGVYIIIALILSFIGTSQSSTTDCNKKNIVYLSNNRVHLSLVIPVEYLNDRMQSGIQVPSGTRYVSFGWGDREFYLNTPEWSDLTLKTAFVALFLKSASVMHVTYYSGISQRWKWIGVCPDQLEQLMAFIEGSFVVRDGIDFVPIQCPGYAANDCFFAANGSFSCFKTCNVWVNQAFKAAGIPTSVWSPFVYGVEYHVGS